MLEIVLFIVLFCLFSCQAYPQTADTIATAPMPVATAPMPVVTVPSSTKKEPVKPARKKPSISDLIRESAA
jgi:hypothetical protein